MTTVYLLIVNNKYHSAHTDKAALDQWKACKSHDGCDTEVVTIEKTDAIDLLGFLQQTFKC